MDHAKTVSGSPQDYALMCLPFDAKLPAILKFGNMESQKRPRSEHNDTSVSKTFPRIAIPIRSETKEAVKLLVNCGTNPGIVSCSVMRQKENLMEFVVTVNK